MASSSSQQSPQFPPSSSSVQTTPPPPRPIGFVAPQCFRVTNNGHGDIPSALLGHQQVGNYKQIETHTPQSNTAINVVRSQSFPFGNPAYTPSYGIYPPINSSPSTQLPLTSAVSANYNPCPMPFMTPPKLQTSSNLGLGFGAFHQGQIFSAFPQQQPRPPPQPQPHPSTVNNLAVALRRNSFSAHNNHQNNNVEVVPPKPGPSYPGNLYKALTEQVRSLTSQTNDLIDLGQDDGRNVLETFDKPALPPTQIVPEAVPVVAMRNHSKSPKIESIKLPPSRDKDGGGGDAVFLSEFDETDRKSDGSASSRPASVVSSNYGWKSDISLYPSLPPSATSYDTLQSRVGSEAGDPSILYDAYNQFEYLYQVSISSETSSFYWHPSDASPYSSGAPPSPSRPPEYVSSQSVRMAKARRRSSDNSVSVRWVLLYLFSISNCGATF